jgi:hypothetical protein
MATTAALALCASAVAPGSIEASATPAPASAANDPILVPIPAAAGTCARFVTDEGRVFGWDSAAGRSFRWVIDGDVEHTPAGTGSVVDVNAAGVALLASGDLWLADGSVLDLTPFLPVDFYATDLGATIVAGTFPSGTSRRFGVWSATAGFVDLGTGSGTNVFVTDVNELDQLIGHRTTAQGIERGFTWSAATGIVQLGTVLGSNSNISPTVITDAGMVAGDANPNASPEVRAFRWTPATGMVVGPTGTVTSPTAANSSGLIVGTSPGPFTPFGFGWKGSAFDDHLYSGPPTAVNSHDQVVGYANSGAWIQDASSFTDLGDFRSYALDINNLGLVAGCIADPEDDLISHAAVWVVDTEVAIHWTAAEYARIQQLMAFYDMDYDELTKFGVYVAAFINGIDPSPTPTPITVDPPGTAQTQTITWQPDEIALLEAVKHRWVLDDEGAHRWGYMLLSFIATIQGS